jgi:hypothetical protein
VSIKRGEESQKFNFTFKARVSCQKWTRLLQSQSFCGIFDDCFDGMMSQHYSWGHCGVTVRSTRHSFFANVTDEVVRHPVAEKAVRRCLALLPSIEQIGDDYLKSLEQRQESTFEHPFALSGDLAKHQCPLNVPSSSDRVHTTIHSSIKNRCFLPGFTTTARCGSRYGPS